MLPNTPPLEGLPEFIRAMTGMELLPWQQHWLDRHGDSLAVNQWAPGTTPDWHWCLGLPMLSRAEQSIQRCERLLIGLNALPGCGKTTFGRWLIAAADQLGLAIAVISIDDFYLPAEEMDQAMAGNPWGVPRALPGSHDIDLMVDCLARWKRGDAVTLPQFDKALRGGRGDRSGSIHCNADVLLVEGWFLGCSPLNDGEELSEGSGHLHQPLLPDELRYRQIVQTELKRYKPVWAQIDTLWQLAASDFNAPEQWKRQQEQTMQNERGIALSSAAVTGFIRMIQSAIPATSFALDQASVVIELDPDRRFQRIRVQGDQDSLSSVSLTGYTKP
ncbi:MAG: phosphoribulokinase [Synechococcus sp.]